jgi:hypothetical protein
MKVKLIKKDKGLNTSDYELIKDFLRFLYNEIPLEKGISVHCLPKRVGEMTTGSNIPEHGIIKVLTNNRLNRDILRTIAHEWIHEHQINVLGRKIGQNIGGKNVFFKFPVFARQKICVASCNFRFWTQNTHFEISNLMFCKFYLRLKNSNFYRFTICSETSFQK